MDTVWCNAERVGGMEGGGAWSTPRRYAIPAALTEGRDRLRLLVRVVDTGGEGGITGTGEDMQLVRADGAGAAVPLADAWARQRSASMSALPAWPRGGRGSPNRPAALWNAMIAPLVPFPFTGVIWYQGEANRKRAAQYERLFPVMIRDWRHCLERTLPFHFVQIAPFAYKKDSDDQVAGLRMAQGAALALPRTGMVVTLDIGDARDIHPRNKKEVGRRLALQALRDPYGEDVIADGPTPSVVTREGGTLRIKFAGAEGGLVAELPVTGFEVAGRDGYFVSATARLDGDGVVVEATSVPAPTQVRYAWARAPQVTLRSTLGLPAAPFVRYLDR